MEIQFRLQRSSMGHAAVDDDDDNDDVILKVVMLKMNPQRRDKTQRDVASCRCTMDLTRPRLAFSRCDFQFWQYMKTDGWLPYTDH